MTLRNPTTAMHPTANQRGCRGETAVPNVVLAAGDAVSKVSTQLIESIEREFYAQVTGLAWVYSIGSVAPSDEYSRLGFDPLTFGIGFLLLRFLQWSGISLLIMWGTPRFSLQGAGIADWLWRLGGVGLSFLGDGVAIVLYVGVFGIIC